MDYTNLVVVLFLFYAVMTFCILVINLHKKDYFITSIIIFFCGYIALNIFAPYNPENITEEKIKEAYNISYEKGVSYGKEHYHPDSARLKGIEDAIEDAEKEDYYDIGYSDGQYDRAMGFAPYR